MILQDRFAIAGLDLADFFDHADRYSAWHVANESVTIFLAEFVQH
jgi:hypothetical protein